MKCTAIAGLLLSVAVLASPVFAADNNLCTSKLQELEAKVSSLPATANNAVEIKRLLASAKAAQAAKDDKKCATEASQALSMAN